MTQANDPVTGKPVPAVEEFVIEYDACMSCGLCAEVCPFDAIKMDHEFELATDDHGSMTVNKAGLDRPVSYYATLAPTMWAEVKDGAYKKLQGNMKRRSGNIGIAPTAKVKPAAPAAAKPAAATAAPTPAARPTAPVAAVGKNMPEDKAARLAAIRAANAAKTGGAAPPAPAAAEAPSAPESAAPAAPMATAAPEAPTPEAPSAPVAAVGKNMPEDKAARLAAIRAANAAKKKE
jgi:ferredoxin